MTIRLLAQYQGNPPNTIVTLAGGVETALVAAGNATTDLSGGVPPVYVTPANSQIGDVLYGPDGVPLGVADPTGKLLMNFNGITVPGAPTGLTLTPIAGGVLAAFTPSATLGGTVGTGYEVTLSNGRVQRGAASPIVVNSPAGAVTATVKQINGAGLSVASAASASATVTAYTAPTIPGAPTSLVLTAGNGKVTANWTAAASNGSAIRNTVVTLSNGATATALGSATTVDVITPNDVPVTATARANNGEGAGPTSAVSNSVTPVAGDVPSGDALPDVPAGTMLSNFTTAARSLPVSMTDNTDGPSPGKTSNVTGYVAPAQSINMRPLDIGSSPVDLRNGLVSVTFKIRPTDTLARTQANIANCYVNLYNNSDPSVAQTNYMRVSFLGGISTGEIANGEWQTLRLPIEIFSAVGTVPDLQAYLQTVRYIGVEFGHNSTNSDAYRASVDFANTFANPLTKGLVVLGFDDCRRDTKAYAYPMMQAADLPGVLYPGATLTLLDSNDAFYLNTADVLEMQSAGWQTAFQAGTTESPGMSVELFEANEIAPLKAMYLTKGFLGHDDGSYFSNVGFGSIYQSVFDANFRTMRGFKTFTDSVTSPRPETLPPSNPRELRAYGVNTAANSFTNGVGPFITRAAVRKSVAVLVFHATGVGDTKHAVDGGVLSTFEKTVEYLSSPAGLAAVDTVTWDEAVGRWRLAFA